MHFCAALLIDTPSFMQVLWNGAVPGGCEEECLGAAVDFALSPLPCGETISRPLQPRLSLGTSDVILTPLSLLGLKIRKTTASQVYEMLLTYDDVIDDDQVLADVMASLSDTNW